MELTEHIEVHVKAAQGHLTQVLAMIDKDPHPGLTTWLMSLALHLQCAIDEITKAQISPKD